MRALVKMQRGAGHVALRDWPEPTIGPREVLIEVRACGMSLNGCQLDERDLIPGIQQGSMKALASWVRESDTVLSF